MVVWAAMLAHHCCLLWLIWSLSFEKWSRIGIGYYITAGFKVFMNAYMTFLHTKQKFIQRRQTTLTQFNKHRESPFDLKWGEIKNNRQIISRRRQNHIESDKKTYLIFALRLYKKQHKIWPLLPQTLTANNKRGFSWSWH